MLSIDYRWYFGSGVADPEDIGNFQFIHKIHEGPYIDNPNDYQLVYPLMEVLQPQTILRIKANLLTKTPDHIVHGMHNDVIVPGSLTAVYYLNTNNGFTVFQDDDKVDSVANRMVIFRSNVPHSGATCTDEQRRVVININYIPWRDDKKWQGLMDDADIKYRDHWEKNMAELNNLRTDDNGVAIK